MVRFLSFSVILLLASCVLPQRVENAAPGQRSSNSASSTGAQIPLEQVPSELSVSHFSKMKLVGTGLTLTKISKNSAYTRYTIGYRSNGLWITGIMNIPEGEGPFPLVIFNHGYIERSVYTTGRGLKREQDALARRGFAVLHTDYRGHAESDESPDTRKVYDAGLEYAMDSANAILAVREAEISRIDATRVAMLGHSMGGGVTLNIAIARPDLIDAIVLYAPVNTDAWENFFRWRDKREDDDRTREVLKSRDENPEAWDALSTRTHLADLRVPVLLFQGTNDKDVPNAWSDDLYARLKNLGKDVTYVVYEGEGHEFSQKFSDFMDTTEKFLDEELGVRS